MRQKDQPILDVPYHPTRSIGRASAEDRITDRYHCRVGSTVHPRRSEPSHDHAHDFAVRCPSRQAERLHQADAAADTFSWSACTCPAVSPATVNAALKAVLKPLYRRHPHRPGSAAAPGASLTRDAGGDMTAADHIVAVRLTLPVPGRSQARSSALGVVADGRWCATTTGSCACLPTGHGARGMRLIGRGALVAQVDRQAVPPDTGSRPAGCPHRDAGGAR
jgi:hypothetical protein